MSGEAIIVAVIGVIFGGGGVRLLGHLFGPERDEAIAKYYRSVIRNLRKENEELWGRVKQLEDRGRELEERITGLEVAQDHPPPHLG